MKVLDNKKYDLMGVTPVELYHRQNGLCYLELAYDEIDGVKTPGSLYCTNGKEYAETSCMLNPTFECVKCMTSFFMEEVMERENKQNINDFIFTLIKEIGYGQDLEESYFSVNKNTYNKLLEYFKSTVIPIVGFEPLKKKEGETYLMGRPLKVDRSINDNVILVNPKGKGISFDG